MDKGLKNFSDALKKLEDFCTNNNGSEIEQAGVIQAFEFTFEQCWKTVQKLAAHEKFPIASPKKAFEWALQRGWIDPNDEKNWVALIDDRNLTTHTYRSEVALKVFRSVNDSYLGLFKKILRKIQVNP